MDRDFLHPDVVEAAAQAIYRRFSLSTSTPAWDELGDSANYWRGWGKDALIAALRVGVVRQEWRICVRSHGTVNVIGRSPVAETVNDALDSAVDAGWPDPFCQARYTIIWPDETIITTPWKDANPGDGNA